MSAAVIICNVGQVLGCMVIAVAIASTIGCFIERRIRIVGDRTALHRGEISPYRAEGERRRLGIFEAYDMHSEAEE